jgi:hypothetical protein
LSEENQVVVITAAGSQVDISHWKTRKLLSNTKREKKLKEYDGETWHVTY